MSGIEAFAVVLALVYLALAIRQNIWCWAAALVSTSLYVWIMFQASLYMESLLQLFYIAMAVYGWQQWRRHGPAQKVLPVSTVGARFHVLAIGSVLILSGITGWLLHAYSNAALPWVDSFTTWGAMVATWMVARKILENWVYWFVIDAVSMYLYISRDLYLTALLFLVYLFMIVAGYFSRRSDIKTAEV